MDEKMEGYAFIDLARESHVNVAQLGAALRQGRVEYQDSQGGIYIPIEPAIKYILEVNPSLKGQCEEVILEKLPEVLRKAFYPLEHLLDGATEKEMILNMCTEIYQQLPPEKKSCLSANMLYVTSMNLGVIQIERPPYNPEGDVLDAVTKAMPYLNNKEKVQAIFFNEGSRRIEKTRHPLQARQEIDRYLQFLKRMDQ
jgi:hypothetical protein